MKQKKIIGITGGVGAGKSSVLAVLKNDFGAKIFRGKEALKTMNSIIHPLVWKTMKEEAEAASENLVIIEAAVFDTAPKNFFDELWYVYTTKENRIVRLMENRGYSREKCEDIIGRQASEEEYRALCSRVIDNNGDESDIKRQLKEILDHEIC